MVPTSAEAEAKDCACPLRLVDDGEPEMVGRWARLVRSSAFDLGWATAVCRRMEFEPESEDDDAA
jgi:hypothetical protein